VNVTASKLGLAMACTHPWTGGLAWVESRGAQAHLGNAIHALAERHVRDGAADVDGAALEFSLQPAQVLKLRMMFQRWLQWAERHDTTTWRVEQAFAIDPVDGRARLLPSKHHRDYSALSEREIGGTADVVDVTAHGVMVADYKSGVWVDPPQDSAQMRALALAVSRAYGRPDVVARIVRVMPDGVRDIEHHFDALELAVIDDELHELYRRLQMPTGPTPGQHCRFCPVRGTCAASQYRLSNQAKGVSYGHID